MSRYDGLIIPRSYSEYINKTDAATLQQALQLSGVLSDIVAAGDNKAVKSAAVNTALAQHIITTIGGKVGIVFGVVAVTSNTIVELPIEFIDTNYVIIAWNKWNDNTNRQSAEPTTTKTATFVSSLMDLHSASYIAIGRIN